MVRFLLLALLFGCSDRRCWQESRYKNTLQHDIHREWKCHDEAGTDRVR
jgi:hypothetical protein